MENNQTAIVKRRSNLAIQDGIVSKVQALSLHGDQPIKARIFLAQNGEKLKNANARAIAAAFSDLESKLGVVERKSQDENGLLDIVASIRKMYGNLTIQDMTEAVYLLLSEKLTKPDKKVLSPSSHYQNLSLAFVCEWLNAYQRYRGEAIREIRSLLPYEFEQMSDERKEAAELDMKKMILLAIEERESGEVKFHQYAYPEIYQFFEKEGIFVLDNERKHICFDRAKSLVNEKIRNENKRNALKIAASPHLEVFATNSMYQRKARELACEIAFEETENLKDLLLGLN